MPAAVVAPAIAGGASIVSGILGSRAQNKATNSQQQANAAALEFEKQKEATRQQNYKDAMEQYKNAWSAWNSGRLAGLQHYGFDTSAFTPSASSAPALSGSSVSIPAGATPIGQSPVSNVSLSTPTPLKMYAAQPKSLEALQSTNLASLLAQRPMVQ